MRLAQLTLDAAATDWIAAGLACCKASGMEVSCANRIEDEIQRFVQTLPVRKGCVMPIE